MCNMYSQAAPGCYDASTRSLRIEGHCTSIRLENAFWDVLERMAAAEGRPLNDLICALYRERLEGEPTSSNFTSLLRCACLIFLDASSPSRRDVQAA